MILVICVDNSIDLAVRKIDGLSVLLRNLYPILTLNVKYIPYYLNPPESGQN